MSIKKICKVVKIADTVTDKAEAEELEKKRTVQLKSEDLSVSIVGNPEELKGFSSGDSVEISVQCVSERLNADEGGLTKWEE